MFQNFALFPWLTVRQNIAFGLELKKFDPTKISTIVERYLKLIGLEQFGNSYPSTLSGGMQQRVAIARTLANDPDILLLDEPFGALDVQTRSQLQEFLASMWEEEKKTTILVTHDVEEAIYLADRVFVLSTRPGTIKEEIHINLPRPRRPEMRFDDEFVRMKKHISYIIRSESIKASLTKTDNKDTSILRVGLDAWLGNTPFYIAKDQDLFRKNNLETEIVSIEKDKNRLTALINDELDLRNVSLDTAILFKDQFPELEIVMVQDLSLGGDALVTPKHIHSIKELKGKRIAAEKMWVSHFFLLYLLQKAGLSSRDVIILDMKGSDIGSALIGGNADAAVLWEPWLSKLLELREFKVLADTKQYPVLWDVMVAKKSVIAAHKADIEKLKQVWADALAFMQKERREAVSMAASYIGISNRELEEGIDKMQFVNSFDKKAMIKIIEESQEVLYKEKLLLKKFSAEEFIRTAL